MSGHNNEVLNRVMIASIKSRVLYFGHTAKPIKNELETARLLHILENVIWRSICRRSGFDLVEKTGVLDGLISHSLWHRRDVVIDATPISDWRHGYIFRGMRIGHSCAVCASVGGASRCSIDSRRLAWWSAAWQTVKHRLKCLPKFCCVKG